MSSRALCNLVDRSLNPKKQRGWDWWGWVLSLGYFFTFYKRIKASRANYSEYFLALMVLFTLNAD